MAAHNVMCAGASQETVDSTDSKNGTVSFDETLKCMSRVARAWQDDELLARKLEDESPDGSGDAPDIAEAFKVHVTRMPRLVRVPRGASRVCTEAFHSARGCTQALQGEGEGVSVSNLCLLMESAGLLLSEDDIVRMLQDVGAKRNEDGSIPFASFVKLLIA